MNRPPPDIEPIDLEPDASGRWSAPKRRTDLLKVERRLDWLSGFLLGILFGMVLGSASHVRSEPVTGQPYVIDGDTVRLRGGETIRILNIDAPETARARCEAEAALGYKAKEHLARLLRGATITLDRCDGKRCTDPYGRTLARVFANGKDVGETLISEGLATRWPRRFDGCGFTR